MDASINQFYRKSLELNGREIQEQDYWNTEATAQSIRHFAYGIMRRQSALAGR